MWFISSGWAGGNNGGIFPSHRCWIYPGATPRQKGVVLKGVRLREKRESTFFLAHVEARVERAILQCSAFDRQINNKENESSDLSPDLRRFRCVHIDNRPMVLRQVSTRSAVLLGVGTLSASLERYS